MVMKDNYVSVEKLPECMKLVLLDNGQKLLFNHKNDFVDLY